MVSAYNILKHDHRDECDGRVEVEVEGAGLHACHSLHMCRHRSTAATPDPAPPLPASIQHAHISHILTSEITRTAHSSSDQLDRK